MPGWLNLQGKTRTSGYGCRISTDYPTPAYLCMTIQCWSRRIFQILWGKCTTSAEYKTIRIAVSAVMDDRLDLRDSLKKFCFQNKKSFSKEVFGKAAQEVPVLEEYKGWVPWRYAVWMSRVATKLRGEDRVAGRSEWK